MEKLLPDICRIQYGYAFDSAKFSDFEGVPLIRIRDVVRGFSETYTTEACGAEYIVNDGDMLIGMDGEFNIAHWKGGKAYLNQRVCRLIPSNEVDALYLYYFMPKALKAIEDKTPFVTVKHLSAKELNKVVVPMPLLDEQKKIASSLQKVDELIALRKEQLAKLDRLVKSRFVELFGDPKYNKSNLVKIGEIGALTSGGTPSRAKPEYFEGDIRWYSAGELNSLYLPDSVEHISERALQQSSAKLFNKGTLMIGMYDTAAFKMGILTEDSSSNQACANLNPKQGYNIVWLYYLFDIMKPIFLQERQGVRQKNLSLSKIKEFEVPFAPFELQERFAAFVEQTDKSKLAIQQSLDKLELLKKSLMQEYFG